MSREWQNSSYPGPPPAGLVGLLVGLFLGLFSMSAAPFLYYFVPFAPTIPAFLAALAVIIAIRQRAVMAVAEGLLAATLFGVVLLAVDLHRLLHPG